MSLLNPDHVALIHADLARAQAELAVLAKPTDLHHAERAWKALLDCLEAVWNKLEIVASQSGAPGNGWKSAFKPFRREDPLLLYLALARDAQTHTLRPIVHVEPSSMATRAIDRTQRMYIEELIFDSTGHVSSFSGSNVEIVFTPGELQLLSATSRGVTAEPPTTHSGIGIGQVTPHRAAELGVLFYEFALRCLVDACAQPPRWPDKYA